MDIASRDVPLCIDLDGTLLRTDTLFELVARLLRRDPLACLLLPFWAAKGRAFLKDRLSVRLDLDVDSLPVHEEVVALLESERAKGREVVLVTGANRRVAEGVCRRFPALASFLASSEEVNLTGPRKEAALRERYGERGFDYVGNSRKDLPVWRSARNAVVVSSSRRLIERARSLSNVVQVISPARGSALYHIVRSIRPHQWIKNVLVFVPMIMAHDVEDLGTIKNALFAFASFALCASSIYLLNDLVDLDSDRHHREKRRRPLAQGNVSIPTALLLMPLLLAGSMLLGLGLGGRFSTLLGVYLATTVSYSFYLKRVLVLDTVVLASLYTLRLVAGGAATGTPLSFWLLAFSMFLFFSLSHIKRVSELYNLESDSGSRPHASDGIGASAASGVPRVRGRAYRTEDRLPLMIFGCSSGALAVLVLAFYLNSPEVSLLHSHPKRLWAICPLMFYWITRNWVLANRGAIAEDPIVFAMRDRVSYLVILAVLAVTTLAV